MNLTIPLGEKVLIIPSGVSVTGKRAGAPLGKMDYSVAHTAVATVTTLPDGKAEIIGKQIGTTTLTATDKDNGLSETLFILVAPAVGDPKNSAEDKPKSLTFQFVHPETTFAPQGTVNGIRQGQGSPGAASYAPAPGVPAGGSQPSPAFAK
jgi:hypothetical protein